MTTPLLAIPEVSDGQINQYLVYNEALRLLESASNQLLSINLALANYSLSGSEFLGNFYFSATGNSAARSITVPAFKRFFSVFNGGSADLSIIRGSTTQTLASSTGATFYSDGTANGLIKLGGGGSGGLAWFSSSKVTAAPNASVPVVVISPDDAATDVDFCARPKGTGAFTLQVPDGLVSGGNKRGANAVDLQTIRSAANEVASGTGSFAAGVNSRASGVYSVAINGVASASNAVAVGGTASAQQAYSFGQASVASGLRAYAIGYDCLATAEVSFASGFRSNTKARLGANAFASGMFAAHGDAQSTAMVLRRSTTNATPGAMGSDGGNGSSYNQMILSDSSTVCFRGKVIARQNSTGDVSAWEFSGVIKRGANAAATALVGSVTPVLLSADAGAAAWAVSVSADTTNGALQVTVTGEASKTIRWVCVLDCCEVVG